ncbi:unnamed protein product [Ectocarpus sp. 12 AP-2014]
MLLHSDGGRGNRRYSDVDIFPQEVVPSLLLLLLLLWIVGTVSLSVVIAFSLKIGSSTRRYCPTHRIFSLAFHPRWPHIFGRWLQVLSTVLCCVTGARAAPNLHKIKVDPTAALWFPSTQLSAACGIINIDGLGPLDGDYSLLHDMNSTENRPTWIGTSANTQHLLLSFQPVVGGWAIGSTSWSRAFLPVGSKMPPTQSSRWQVFNDGLSSFEGTGKIVSISSCTALAIWTLPDALAACDGPYRVRAMNNENGVVAWVHVSDERCTMLHDHAGNSLLAIDDPIEVGKASSFGDAAVGDPLNKEWWTEITRNVSTLQNLGVDAGVLCTAASQTTRLVFGLTTTRQTTTPCNDANNAGTKAEATACTSARFDLSSQQDGSIISSSSSIVHLQIDDAVGLMQSGAMTTGWGDLGLAETAADDGGPAIALLVKVVVDGVEATKTSLQEASTKGVLLSFDDLQGTHAFEISVLETQAGRDVCLAETAMILEIFTAEPHIVTGRSSIRRKLSQRSSGIVTSEGGPKVTRVVFLADLEVLDGYKLSTLHLMKHLPTNFRASTLDLSCSSGDLPVKDLFDKEDIEVFHLCIEIPNEVWSSVQAQGVTIFAFLYSALVGAPTWNDVVSVHPGVALALSDLYHHLVKFDVLVMSNGGKDTDAYVLQIARLAGVRTRMVNLGAIAGGYMSPLFSGATSIVGPSHYVAHNPAVIRNAGGLPIKVCHPVMDAARVLEAARSCHATRVPIPDQPETRPGTGEGGADDALAGVLPPARFIMVGRVSSEKTPGVFVRSIAVLQRRWLSGGRQETRQIEGVMVGKGPILRQMEKLALDLRAGVRFTGALSIDKVPCEVQLATALVLPSMCPETFGMVGPEAMLLGVPLVTFGFGGSGELVRHMENGLLVAEPTPRALADALELLARDTALRDRLGAAARLDALRALSLPEMVACHVNEF